MCLTYRQIAAFFLRLKSIVKSRTNEFLFLSVAHSSNECDYSLLIHRGASHKSKQLRKEYMGVRFALCICVYQLAYEVLLKKYLHME